MVGAGITAGSGAVRRRGAVRRAAGLRAVAVEVLRVGVERAGAALRVAVLRVAGLRVAVLRVAALRVAVLRVAVLRDAVLRVAAFRVAVRRVVARRAVDVAVLRPVRAAAAALPTIVCTCLRSSPRRLRARSTSACPAALFTRARTSLTVASKRPWPSLIAFSIRLRTSGGSLRSAVRSADLPAFTARLRPDREDARFLVAIVTSQFGCHNAAR